MSGNECEAVNFAEQTLMDKIMYGGLGYGTICLPKDLGDYFYMIAFPPLYAFINQKRNGFKNMNKIIECFILTCFMYFPGLIYAMKMHVDSK